MLVKVQQALRKGYSWIDKYKLMVLGGHTSRPILRPFTSVLTDLFTKDGLIKIKLKIAVNERISPEIEVALRKEKFESDYLSMLELLLFNCYRMPVKFSPDLIIDAGGNTGLFTLICNKVYPGVQILLFEPVQENLKLISKHLSLNKAMCLVHEGIISNIEGEVPFYIRNANNSSFDSTEPYKNKVLVKSYDLISEINKFSFKSALIKLDIEGAETHVIPEILDKISYKEIFLVGELHNWPENLEILSDKVRKSGYKMDIFDQDEVCLLFHIYRQ